MLEENIFLPTNAVIEHARAHKVRGIARPRNPRVSSHRWFRTRGVSVRHHSGRTGRRDHPLVCHPLHAATPRAVTARPARTNAVFTSRTPERRTHRSHTIPPVLPPRCRFLPPCILNTCPLADKQGRGLASPLKSRTLLSGGHGHGDISTARHWRRPFDDLANQTFIAL